MRSTQNVIQQYEINNEDQLEKIAEAVDTYLTQPDKEEEDSKFYTKFANKGSDALKTMTGFTSSEFLELYSRVEGKLKVRGRGKKPEISVMDSFFFTLVMLKHYEKWDKFAITYGVKRTIIVNAINRTLEKIEEPLCDALIKPIFHDEQLKLGIQMEDYPEVALVVDVTFQTRSRPKMMFNDAQFYYSGKHEAYGYKTEIAHLPNGLAAFVSKPYGGSVHDFTIFKDNVEMYNLFMEKRGLDHRVVDEGELKREFPKSWALLADKGYQGVSELCRAILPSKGKTPTREENIRNKRIAKNRIICENFYGRMKKLFKIIDGKYRWDEDSYASVFRICVALTNYHVTKNPLRNEDGIYYKSVLNNYATETETRKRKQQQANEKHRKKQKLDE